MDIDQQAVEVTKLSLLLKVLEGENAETLQKQLRLFHERALPDLEGNIKCGNSLIGPDYYAGKQQTLFGEEESYRVNAFDWMTEFPEIMKAGGFDAVIGNPPYGALFSPDFVSYFRNRFRTLEVRGESYVLFIEQACILLRFSGQLGFIVPDTYLNLGFTSNLRSFVLSCTRIREIDILPRNVFRASTVDTTLLFAEKAPTWRDYHKCPVLVKRFRKHRVITEIGEPDAKIIANTENWHRQDAFNVVADTRELDIIYRVESGCRRIEHIAQMYSGIKAYEVGKGSPPQTPAIRDMKPYTSHQRKDSTWMPFYDGEHVGRYHLLWRDNNWIKYGPWLAAPRDAKNFQGKKILIRKITGKTLIATYVPHNSYCNTLLFVLKTKESADITYEYLLGIMNSTFMGWYFRKKFQVSAEDTFPQIMIRDIMQFPIPRSAPAAQHKTTQLVARMLTLQDRISSIRTSHGKKVLQRQIDATDTEIDRLVYEMYGLTEEEIAIVEEATK